MRAEKGYFLSLFASRKKRKLYNLGREDYYHSLNALNVRSSFNFHKNLNNPIHQTEKAIRFYGVEFGKTQKEIKNIFGRPNYTQKHNLPLESQTTLFYKLFIKGIKCSLQMHIYENQLFFAQIQLRTSHKEAKKVFLDLFSMKYKIDDLKWDDSIMDLNGSKITLKDDIVPKASYFSPDMSLWADIGNELNKQPIEDKYWSPDIKKIALQWS